MGLINLEPTLHPGELIRWRRPAARSLADRTVAGTLYATSHGIVFMPNRLNRRRDLVSTRVPLERIESIETMMPPRTLASRRSGGLRRRLAVMTIDGDEQLFVVNQPDRVARELRGMLAL